jgi:SPP1 gp7 family putative phage head morphogenesis protein
MAKSFRLPQWRKCQIDRKYQRQTWVISQALLEMDHFIQYTTDHLPSRAMTHLGYQDPDLSAIDVIGERFYRHVVTEGWKSAHEEALVEKSAGKQRLAAPPKAGIRPLQFLVELFGNKKDWDKVLKRKTFLMARLKRAYLRKLKRRFNEILPKILSGQTSSQEVKTHLLQAWESSRARTENIFKTETTKYFTETQISYFSTSDVEIIGYLFDSVRDMARSIWCKDRHGLIYRPGSDLLRKNVPPCHWQCRSHLIALANTESNRKLLVDPERDPTKRSVEPLPSGWRR